MRKIYNDLPCKMIVVRMIILVLATSLQEAKLPCPDSDNGCMSTYNKYEHSI